LFDGASIVKSARQWHLRAEEIRTLSEDATAPEVTTMMLRIAADYDRLARWAEEQVELERADGKEVAIHAARA
jgi:hypothetical protein